MSRFINPPLQSLGHLPATDRSLIETLDNVLPKECDFFIHPVLNGLTFSLVLLHPLLGVAIIDVPSPGSDISRVFHRQNRACEEIREWYCPRRDSRAGDVPVKTAIYISSESRSEWNKCLRDCRKEIRSDIRRRMVDEEKVRACPLQAILPLPGVSAGDDRLYRDLKSWLLEPDFREIRREPLELDGKQRILATTRTSGGYRRIKGPAGSGKTHVLAARAAQAAAEGNTVLFVSFNLTLVNFVREAAIRWSLFDSPARSKRPMDRITFLNYHAWAKRLFDLAGKKTEYNRLWADAGDDKNAKQMVLECDLSKAVSRLLADLGDPDEYDVIIVDEGQDFIPEWLKNLRQVLRPKGEFVLAIDLTQDLYDRERLLTPGAWEGCGFTGAWSQLDVSYRLPKRVAEFASAFLNMHARGTEFEMPVAEPYQGDLFPCRIRWVQVADHHAAKVCADEVCKMVKNADPAELAFPDTVFVCDTNAFGRSVCQAIGNRGISVCHTFDPDTRESRRQKLGFLFDDAPVKATTIHSFKGWETPSLTIYLGRATRGATWKHSYTALTRLKRSSGGSALTIVCADPALRDFGRKHSDVYEEM